jgi:hypothetical protein
VFVTVLEVAGLSILAQAGTGILGLAAWAAWTRPRWWLDRFVWPTLGPPLDSLRDPLPNRYLTLARLHAAGSAFFAVLLLYVSVDARIRLISMLASRLQIF